MLFHKTPLSYAPASVGATSFIGGEVMENVLEAIRQEQIRLITDKKDMDIAIYHRLKDYLDEAERQVELYIKELGR